MVEGITILSFVEYPQRNSDTGELEKWYRYRCKTAKGNVFTVDVPETVARGPKLQEMINLKAKELENLMGK